MEVASIHRQNFYRELGEQFKTLCSTKKKETIENFIRQYPQTCLKLLPNVLDDLCGHGYLEIIKRLLDLYNKKYAEEKEKISLGEKIHNQLPQFNISRKKNSALRSACDGGHVDLVKWILSQIHDTNGIEKSLVRASANGHTEVVKLLLEKKPNINLTDAFNMACQCKSVPIVRVFDKINPELKHTIGKIDLLRTIYRHTEMFNLYLEWFPNALHENYWKIMDVAFRYENLEICRKVLDFHSDEIVPRLIYRDYSNGVSFSSPRLDFLLIHYVYSKINILEMEFRGTGSICTYQGNLEYNEVVNTDNDKVSLIINCKRFSDLEKSSILRSLFARIKIKWWILGCLYNPNTRWGKRYTSRLLLEDNPFVLE